MFYTNETVIYSRGSFSNPIHFEAKFIRYTDSKIKAEIRILKTDERKLVLVANLRRVDQK